MIDSLFQAGSIEICKKITTRYLKLDEIYDDDQITLYDISYTEYHFKKHGVLLTRDAYINTLVPHNSLLLNKTEMHKNEYQSFWKNLMIDSTTEEYCERLTAKARKKYDIIHHAHYGEYLSSLKDSYIIDVVGYPLIKFIDEIENEFSFLKHIPDAIRSNKSEKILGQHKNFRNTILIARNKIISFCKVSHLDIQQAKEISLAMNIERLYGESLLSEIIVIENDISIETVQPYLIPIENGFSAFYLAKNELSKAFLNELGYELIKENFKLVGTDYSASLFYRAKKTI